MLSPSFDQCPHCKWREDKLLDRTAALALCIRKAAAKFHYELRHPRTGNRDDWQRCPLPPCADMAKALGPEHPEA